MIILLYHELLHFMGDAEDEEVDAEPPIFSSGRIDYHVEIDAKRWGNKEPRGYLANIFYRFS